MVERSDERRWNKSIVNKMTENRLLRLEVYKRTWFGRGMRRKKTKAIRVVMKMNVEAVA